VFGYVDNCKCSTYFKLCHLSYAKIFCQSAFGLLPFSPFPFGHLSLFNESQTRPDHRRPGLNLCCTVGYIGTRPPKRLPFWLSLSLFLAVLLMRELGDFPGELQLQLARACLVASNNNCTTEQLDNKRPQRVGCTITCITVPVVNFCST